MRTGERWQPADVLFPTFDRNPDLGAMLAETQSGAFECWGQIVMHGHTGFRQMLLRDVLFGPSTLWRGWTMGRSTRRQHVVRAPFTTEVGYE